MTLDRAIDLLKIEQLCVAGNNGKCDRNCAQCELVQDEHELIEMYFLVINLIEGIKKNENC